MMAYEIALRKSDVFAAVAPVEGSVHVSYYETIADSNTTDPVSVLEVHGVQDTTIPSNTTISDDYWKYEKT
jgi:poly(3-hydroxybutyrate) depolymerase